MPYIEKKDRKDFDGRIKGLAGIIRNKGEMNYVISELVGQWIVQNKLFSYEGISNAISAVHDAEIELNRRILMPYEVNKILINEDLDSFKSILERLEWLRNKSVKEILADKME
jgi:alpha/beta superfamily hydrolase